MKTKKRYCYLEPDFPRSAFVVIVFFVGKNTAVFPLHQTVTSQDDAARYVKEIYDHMKSKSPDIDIPELCSLIPITFHTLIPLKREYWQHPTLKYTYDQRDSLFLKLMDNPTLHQLLVTPAYYNSKKKIWEFTASLPLPYNASPKIIEQFMFQSDQAVDARAKSAAIYSVGEPKRYNWKENEVMEFDNKDIDERN